METIRAEVIDTKTKQDARGRKIADEARRAEVLGGYEASGLTQKAYARREGMNYHTFVAWWIQHRRGRTRALRPSLPAPMGFAEVRLPPVASGAPLEVTLPGGIVVRGAEAASIAALIKALEA